MADIGNATRYDEEVEVRNSTIKSKRPKGPPETFRFNEAEGEFGFLIRENTGRVGVYPSLPDQILPESKMKVRSLVDFNWDPIYCIGRMVSVHASEKFLAYILKIQNVGGVRIVDLETTERILIKGTRGHIKDVEFMHKVDDLIVAFIDEYGTVFIYKIIKDAISNKMQEYLIVEITLDGPPVECDYRRFVWCKFAPDDTQEGISPKDCSFHFAVLQDDKVYASNLCQLIDKFSEGHHMMSEFEGYHMTIDAHTDAVLDAAFAPDGTALATGSKDGTVKFFQIYLLGNDFSESTRCLYSWSPHDGKPVFKIHFLDDHSWDSTTISEEGMFWKHMLTAGPNMTEIKIWACKNWNCLQAIRFNCPSPSQLMFDVNITSKFLVVTDIHRKTMFVFNIVNNVAQESVRLAWVSEFSLPSRIISFTITNARLLSFGDIEAGGYDYAINELDAIESDEFCVLDVTYVQPRSLQVGSIAFQPPKKYVPQRSHSPNRITFDTEVMYIEGKPVNTDLSDESAVESAVEISPDEDEMERPPSPARRSSNASDKGIKPTAAGRMSTSPRPLSPKSPKQTPSSSEYLSQKLSKLLLNAGTSVAPSFSNGIRTTETENRDRSERARSLPPEPAAADIERINNNPGFISADNTLAPEESIYETRESPTHNIICSEDIRSHHSSSRASSSLSREVEEILSPKTAEQLRLHKSDLTQHLGGEAIEVNNFDIEGNLVDEILPSQYKPKPRQTGLASPKVEYEMLPPQLPQQVLEQVSSIMEMVQAQSMEMRELKREMSRLNMAQSVNARLLDEPAMSRILDKYFSQNNYQVQRVEDLVKNLHILEKQRPQGTQLPPNFPELITGNIGRLLTAQMESTILPSILSLFEPVRSQVQAELVKMVLNAEGRIKQELKQMLENPDFRVSLASEIESSVKSTCESVIPRVLLTSIVPSFEKSLQSMYAKINDTFLKGTKEYMGGIEGTLGAKRAQEISSQEELKEQLNSMQDAISSVLQVELESQMLRVLSNLQTSLVKQIEEVVVRELGRKFHDQQKFLELSIVSRAATPAMSLTDHNTSFATPPVDPEAVLKQIFKLAEKGDVAAAFVQASHYSDITYMMKLAEAFPPGAVFTSKLPTKTHVAIIQQMATDLTSYTETKIAYLNLALTSLNMNDRTILRSVVRIVPVYQASLKKFAESSPTSPHMVQLNVLEMVFVAVASRYAGGGGGGGPSTSSAFASTSSFHPSNPS